MPIGSFAILGDRDLGKKVLSEVFPGTEPFCLVPSLLHGRSVAVPLKEGGWCSVKGGGWNYGGPLVYLSRKDDQLAFGLLPESASRREVEVSKKIREFTDKNGDAFLSLCLIDLELPEELSFLKGLRYADGCLVRPSLLFTKVRCPYRPRDLAFMKDEEKEKCVSRISEEMGADRRDFIPEFSRRLGERVGNLHAHGFLNDTLDDSNCTLMGEILDYEWMTAPGIPLEDGTMGDVLLDERREKEILYGAEIVLRLGAFLHEDVGGIAGAYRLFGEGYRKGNKAYWDGNASIRKILGGEKFVI